jgi:hypothetical protein
MRTNRYPSTIATRTVINLDQPRVRILGFSLALLLYFVCQIGSLQAQTVRPLDQKQPTGHENHKISLSRASVLTLNYRNSSAYHESLINGEFFGKDGLLAALSQENCIGLRIYYGKQDDGTPVLVFVGVDQSGKDIVNGFVGEDGLICPPVCHEPNALTDIDAPTVGLSNLEPTAENK